MDAGFSEEIDQLQAASLRALSSPHRVRLVHLLGDGPHDVTAIGLALGLGQAATSQHLSAMRGAGLVEAHREGRTVTYQLVDPDVATACGLMRAVLVRRLTRLGRAAAAVRLHRPRLPMETHR
jgi:DNA-binding transcriptional ArsR family regulator